MPPNNPEKFNTKRLGILLVILALVIVIFLVISYQINSNAKVSERFLSDFSQSQTVPEKKEAIIVRAERAGNAPLTPEEKSVIFNELGGEKAQKYNLTPEEKAAIIAALNAK